MRAGHCPWDGFTDRNVCNIHGDVPKIMSVGPKAAAGEAVMDAKTDGKLGNIQGRGKVRENHRAGPYRLIIYTDYYGLIRIY